ncbi:MAG: OmpA family protein [Alphaproteobacteria bacterium]|nr:OmpA family protein [Alphaproteobacteria bacterium]
MRKHIVILAAFLPALAGCSTNPFTGESQISDTAIGAGGGAALGAGAGFAVGSLTKADPKQAALIGAGVGAVAGAGVGLYMDGQEARLRQDLQDSGVTVTRVGNTVVLNMASNVGFDPGDASIKPRYQKALNAVAQVLAKYKTTRVLIDGHADAQEAQAASLSQARAQAVASYLMSHKITGSRLQLRGWGASQPVAASADAAANRCVEITLQPEA